jgi:hypothetical protein
VSPDLVPDFAAQNEVRVGDRMRSGQTIFLIEWATQPGHQARFAAALGSALLGAPGADEWEQGEVLRSIDGARVVLLGRAEMRPDHAMLRGRTFAQRVVEQVDQTGVHILEARVLEPVSS